MVLGALTTHAMALGMQPLITSHFNNSALNQLVGVDGVDRAVAAILSAKIQEMPQEQSSQAGNSVEAQKGIDHE